jgi:hypothetical protein
MESLNLCHKYSELRKLTSRIAHSEKSDQPIHNSVLHIRDLLDHEPLLPISLGPKALEH